MPPGFVHCKVTRIIVRDPTTTNNIIYIYIYIVAYIFIAIAILAQVLHRRQAWSTGHVGESVFLGVKRVASIWWLTNRAEEQVFLGRNCISAHIKTM